MIAGTTRHAWPVHCAQSHTSCVRVVDDQVTLLLGISKIGYFIACAGQRSRLRAVRRLTVRASLSDGTIQLSLR
jgi:hypothetical protein